MKNISEILLVTASFLILFFSLPSFGQTTEFGDSEIRLKESIGGSQMEVRVSSDTLLFTIYLPDSASKDATTGRYDVIEKKVKYQIESVITVNKIGGNSSVKQFYTIFINSRQILCSSDPKRFKASAYRSVGAKYIPKTKTQRNPYVRTGGKTYRMLENYQGIVKSFY